jgi:hypothetical protein
MHAGEQPFPSGCCLEWATGGTSFALLRGRRRIFGEVIVAERQPCPEVSPVRQETLLDVGDQGKILRTPHFKSQRLTYG